MFGASMEDPHQEYFKAHKSSIFLSLLLQSSDINLSKLVSSNICSADKKKKNKTKHIVIINLLNS